MSAIVAAIGGLVAAIGTFLPWASLSVSIEGGQLSGVDIPSSAQSMTAAGTAHWTGLIALVAAVVVLAGAGASILLAEAAQRRTAAVAAAVAGAVVLVTAVLGMTQGRAILEAETGTSLAGIERAERLGESLGIRGLTIDRGTGVGVFLTALGGLVAAAGASVALRGATGRAPGAPPDGLTGTGFDDQERAASAGPPPEGGPGHQAVQPPQTQL